MRLHSSKVSYRLPRFRLSGPKTGQSQGTVLDLARETAAPDLNLNLTVGYGDRLALFVGSLRGRSWDLAISTAADVRFNNM